MKFITFGNKSVRADLIEAIQIHMAKVTVFCIGGAQYVFFFDTCEQAKEEKARMIAELAEIGG